MEYIALHIASFPGSRVYACNAITVGKASSLSQFSLLFTPTACLRLMDQHIFQIGIGAPFLIAGFVFCILFLVVIFKSETYFTQLQRGCFITSLENFILIKNVKLPRKL